MLPRRGKGSNITQIGVTYNINGPVGAVHRLGNINRVDRAEKLAMT